MRPVTENTNTHILAQELPTSKQVGAILFEEKL